MVSLFPPPSLVCFFFFFFKDAAPTEIYPLPLPDALPICQPDVAGRGRREPLLACSLARGGAAFGPWPPAFWPAPCVGEARHSRGQPHVAGRGRGAAGVPAFLQQNVVLST